MLLKYLSIGLIHFYQKFISPHKGFCCAYHKYSGGRSCSHYAIVAVRRFGVSALWLSLPKRLDDCKVAGICIKEKKENDNCGKYCESIEACNCGKDCIDNLSCGDSCHMPASLPCEGCDCDCGCSGVYKPFSGRQFSFSPFFLFIWLYKKSNRTSRKSR